MKARARSLKKIPVTQLRLGMFVADFCGSWMDHPFWSTKFKLENPADLKTITDSAITELWIDTARGLDVAPGDAPPAEPAESAAEAEA
ncbi:MAG: DUF3391 domain-containing protein, partial [Gammaproteobacteria bacterium]